jgi:hypothetical protein
VFILKFEFLLRTRSFKEFLFRVKLLLWLVRHTRYRRGLKIWKVVNVVSGFVRLVCWFRFGVVF